MPFNHFLWILTNTFCRTIKRVKKQESNEPQQETKVDIYSKYDKMSSSAHSIVLAELHQLNGGLNANNCLNCAEKKQLDVNVKEGSDKYRKAKKKLKQKDKKIKELEDQVEEWRNKYVALLELNSRSNQSTDVNKPV